MNRNQRKKIIRTVLFLFISFIFVLTCILLGYMIYMKADFFSKIQKYLLCCTIALFAYLIIRIYQHFALRRIKKQYPDNKKIKIKIGRFVSHFVMILICFAVGFSSTVLNNLDSFIGEIGETTTTPAKGDNDQEDGLNKYYVYTSIDSDIVNLDSDFANMGVLYEERGAIYNPLKDYMNKNHSKTLDQSFEFITYTTKADCFAALYSNMLKSLIISDEMYYVLIDRDPNFISKTKRIATIELVNAVESKPVNVKKDSFNVLVLGVDVRENEGSVKTDCRCDTVIVASFNPKTMGISLVSIPRDSYVDVNGVKDKLTHAGNYGLTTMIDTVENVLGIEINYYVKFNFKALVDIVDAIGGVEVDVKYPFTEQDSNDTQGAISLEPGMQLLNGEQALAYARHRKTVTDSARANAQQQIIQGLAGKLVSFSSITKFKNLLNAVSKNMMTNLSKQEIYDLMSLAPSLGNATFNSMVITGTDAPQQSFPQYNAIMYTFYLDDASIAQAREQIEKVKNEKEIVE